MPDARATPSNRHEQQGSPEYDRTRANPVLANLRGVRALAEVVVVLFHVGLLPATTLRFRVGAAGVDLFFVPQRLRHRLQHGARQPVLPRTPRLVRVLPACWIATLIAAAATLPAMTVRAAAGWLAQSLVFLPGPGGRPPLIFVAWTLVYEFAFYLLYATVLRLGRSRAPLMACLVLVVAAFVRLPIIGGPWPLLLEFAAGLGIYMVVPERWVAKHIPGSAGLSAAAVGLTLLVVLPGVTGYDPDDYQGVGRVLTWGMPAAMTVMGLVVAEHGGLALRSRPVLLVGAASYAIYLLHPIALGQMLSLAPHAPPVAWLLCGVAITAIVLVGIAFHRTIEVPLVRNLRSCLHALFYTKRHHEGA